ncbi:MAG: hypothetical protein JJV98_15420 [Desulfosarcina sp.]|nr:hypothetical protein [Desulfobacterales bacterium]
MSRGLQLDDGFLTADRRVAQTASEETVIKAGLSVKGMEKILIGKTLQAVNDNRARASELLGISVRTLHNKLKEYQDSQTDFKGEVLL